MHPQRKIGLHNNILHAVITTLKELNSNWWSTTIEEYTHWKKERSPTKKVDLENKKKEENVSSKNIFVATKSLSAHNSFIFHKVLRTTKLLKPSEGAEMISS